MKLRLALVLGLLLAVFLPTASFTSPAIAAPSAPAHLFSTEAAAQAHCPRDIVVWLNLPSGIYHLKSERWYGRTKKGAYVCKREANAAGDRETRNGQ
jgi:hypothetical protein